MDPIWSSITVLVVLLLVLAGQWSGILICSLILTAALMQCGISRTIEIVPVLMMAWSIPVSAYFAALLIERHCLLGASSRSTITTLALALAMSVWLANADFPAWLISAQHSTHAGLELGRTLELCAVVISTAGFCAGLIAFVVIATLVVFELSANCLMRSVRHGRQLSLLALRPSFLLILAAFSLYLVTGFLGRELSPLSLLRSVRAIYG